MGNYLLVTRPPETSSLGTGPLRTPFTDFTAQIGHLDGDKECFPFQLRWIDCCEAHGSQMAKTKCKYLFQDYIECSKKWKQKSRISAMMEQRYYLWFRGVRGLGEKTDLWYETPRYDGYVPNFIIDDKNYVP